MDLNENKIINSEKDSILKFLANVDSVFSPQDCLCVKNEPKFIYENNKKIDLHQQEDVLIEEKNIKRDKNLDELKTKSIIGEANYPIDNRSKIDYEYENLCEKKVLENDNENQQNLLNKQKGHEENLLDKCQDETKLKANQELLNRIPHSNKKKAELNFNHNLSNFQNKIQTPINMSKLEENNRMKKEINNFENKIIEFPHSSELQLNEKLDNCFESQKKIFNSDEKVKLENIEISEFYSRYNILDKSSNLLSFKRKREQLIRESYEAFGFSFDSGENFKKGFSKVEREKIIEKNKRENQILTNVEINSNSLTSKKDSNTKLILSKEQEACKINEKFSNDFMKDALIKKTRVERDKELFLEEQKKLKELEIQQINITSEHNKNSVEESTSDNFLSYKQRKQALLDSSNNEWGDFMTQNPKKKCRIELEKEKFLEEKHKLDANILKQKNSEIKTQVFKFDICDASDSKKKKENSARK